MKKKAWEWLPIQQKISAKKTAGVQEGQERDQSGAEDVQQQESPKANTIDNSPKQEAPRELFDTRSDEKRKKKPARKKGKKTGSDGNDKQLKLF